MKTIDNNYGILEYFFDNFRESPPHINTHFLNLFPNLNRLFHKDFNDFFRAMRINHLNEITLTNVTNNSHEIPLTFSHTYLRARNSFGELPISFFSLNYLLKNSFYFVIAKSFFSSYLLHARLFYTLLNIFFVSFSMPSFNVQKIYSFCGIPLATRTVKLPPWDFQIHRTTKNRQISY